MDLRLEDSRGGMDLEVICKWDTCKATALGESAGSKGENWGQSLEHYKTYAGGGGAEKEPAGSKSEENQKDLTLRMST